MSTVIQFILVVRFSLRTQSAHESAMGAEKTNYPQQRETRQQLTTNSKKTEVVPGQHLCSCPVSHRRYASF